MGGGTGGDHIFHWGGGPPGPPVEPPLQLLSSAPSSDLSLCSNVHTTVFQFSDPEGGSQKAILVVVVVISSSKGPKIPKAFLIRSGAQRNFAHIFVLTLPTDLPSQIVHLFSN